MQKQGLRLANAIPDLGEDALARLRDEFSIITVEEFISASARSGDQLRLHIGLTREQWDKACRTGRNLISTETASRLERPIGGRFPKGAVLAPGILANSDLSRHLGRE